MKKLPTSNSDIYAMVDDGDHKLVAHWKWTAIPNKGKYYISRTSEVGGKKRTMYLHRFLMGEPKGLQIDHINGNTLDNRRRNLRVVTHSQNQQNSKVHRAGKLPGVYTRKHKSGKTTYYARITHRKEDGAFTSRHLGTFPSAEDAHKAWKLEAILRDDKI